MSPKRLKVRMRVKTTTRIQARGRLAAHPAQRIKPTNGYGKA